MVDIMAKLKSMCETNRSRLLYASMFGSILYGTHVKGKSDTDVKGIFIQDRREVLLGRKLRSISFKTGDEHGRNGPGDTDIELWPLDRWLLELLAKGDTSAIDLMFSPSNKECVLFSDPFMEGIFGNPGAFINMCAQGGYAAYAINQARKYGIKGSRLGAIRVVREWLKSIKWEKDARLSAFLDEIAGKFGDGKYCQKIESNGEQSLLLCGKIHMGGTRMGEFMRRVDGHYRTYGQRARDAEKGQGIDWKAISHAMRAIWQMQELMETGRIEYPLKRRDELLAIKQGRIPWPEADRMICEELARTERMCESADPPAYDPSAAEAAVLCAYGELGRID